MGLNQESGPPGFGQATAPAREEKEREIYDCTH